MLVNLICLVCCTGITIAQDGLLFIDATKTSRLDFVHDDGDDQDQGQLPSMMGSGLATFDFDNDGLIDVYFLSCADSTKGLENSTTHHGLFRNLDGAAFVEVSKTSRTNIAAFGLGIAIADYNNDGFSDAAISNFGSVTLLNNNGDGTFTDITAFADLSAPGVAFGAGVAFLDMERDGDLDLYVADYVDYSHKRFKEQLPGSFPYPPGPEQFEHRSDRLFVNLGNGLFIDGSKAAGISSHRSPSMGVVCGDFDSDGDTDIFVCADARPNLYFVNDGNGVFTEQAQLNATAVNSLGVPIGAMGAEAADLDGDGAEDIFVTKYSTQMPLLFKNLIQLGFEDIATGARLGRELVPHVSWGVGASDLDNDGDKDLIVANGHLFKWAHEVEQLTAFRVRNTILQNNGKAQFQNVSTAAGLAKLADESSRGIALDDLNNDGDIDCVVLNSDAAASYLENQTSPRNGWVQIQLIGTLVNRDAVGAKVRVESGDLIQVAEVRSGRGYQSHFGSRLHFGLGKRSKIDRIIVDWLGQTTEYRSLEVNRFHQLRQR